MRSRRAATTPEPDAQAVIGYMRVSTDDATDAKGPRLGIEVQREEITQWCARHRLRLIAIHEDRGVSGDTDFDQRPGLMAALADVRAHRAAILCVLRRDRLARDPVVAGLVERELLRMRATLRSVQGEGTDIDGPGGRLVAAVVDAASAYDLAMIRARTEAALRARRAKGLVSGNPRWGEQKGPEGQILPHLGERTLLARAHDLRAQGYTIRAVAEMLKQEGFRNRKGAPVAASFLHRLLERSVEVA